MNRKATTITLAGLLLLTAIVLTVPEQATAFTDVFYSDGDVDGYIYKNGATWPPSDYVGFDDNDYYISLQDSLMGATYKRHRGYISFDTSGMDSDATITAVNLKMHGYSIWCAEDFDIEIYTSGFETLDVGDWDDLQEYAGTFENSTDWGYSYHSTALPTWVVNRTGLTGLAVVSDRELAEIEPTGFGGVSYFSGNGAYPPILEVSYSLPGSEVHIQTESGYWYNSTAFPEISEWNLTCDLYCFEIDTVPDTKNMTLEKTSISWQFEGVTPQCNYTDNATFVDFSDVLDSTTYRIWFTAPKDSPYCTLYLSVYNQFTGEGFMWEAMRVSICQGTSWDESNSSIIPLPEYPVEPDNWYIIRVSDYFGNSLVDTVPFLANAESIYKAIAVPAYSWQIFNMNEAPILMRIYWNQTGDPWTFFVGPSAIMERMLKGGDYTFMVTFYDTDGYAGATVFYNQTIPLSGLNASFIMVEGTTLTQIVSSVEGVLATQQIITTLLTPDMIWVYSNVPSAPDAEGIARQMTGIEIYTLFDSSYEVVSALRYDNATGTDIALWQPYEVSYGTTVSIYQDVLALSGPYTTAYWLNTTSGTVVSSGTVLPPLITGLGGTNLTLEANNSVTVSRTTNWKEVTLLTWTYSWNIRQYSTTQKLYNNLSTTMYNVYWSYYFQNPESLDLASLKVYDNWNSVYLSLGTHYDITSAGVHFYFNSLASGINKSLTVTVYDLNESVPGDAIASITLYSDSAKTSFCGEGYKICTGTWSNAGAFSYYGTLVFKLDFEDSDKIQPRSVSVYSADDSRLLNPDEYYYAGGTVTVIGSTVGVITPGEGRTYLIAFLFDKDETYTLGLTKPLFVVGGIAISAIYFICVLVPCGAFLFVLTRRPGDRHYRRWDVFLLFLAISFILAALTGLGVID